MPSKTAEVKVVCARDADVITLEKDTAVMETGKVAVDMAHRSAKEVEEEAMERRRRAKWANLEEENHISTSRKLSPSKTRTSTLMQRLLSFRKIQRSLRSCSMPSRRLSLTNGTCLLLNMLRDAKVETIAEDLAAAQKVEVKSEEEAVSKKEEEADANKKVTEITLRKVEEASKTKAKTEKTATAVRSTRCLPSIPLYTPSTSP